MIEAHGRYHSLVDLLLKWLDLATGWDKRLQPFSLGEFGMDCCVIGVLGHLVLGDKSVVQAMCV
jgi:hypothetical protein